MIKNIKSSLTVSCEKDWKKYLLQKVLSLGLTYSQKGNILVVKGDFNLCILEKKVKVTDDHQTKNNKDIHINLSGVQSFQKLESVITYIITHLLPPSSCLVLSKIDNITASFTFPKKVNLIELKLLNPEFQYNKERFPGIFIKLKSGTGIVFNSGKTNIIGCKSEQDILQTWRTIVKYLLTADMKLKKKLKDS